MASVNFLPEVRGSVGCVGIYTTSIYINIYISVYIYVCVHQKKPPDKNQSAFYRKIRGITDMLGSV